MRSASRDSPEAASRPLLILSAAVLFVCCLLILTFGYGRDQAIYAVVADRILKGGMPYRDAWDFKPPGVFLIYALARALLGSASWAIRVLEVGGLLATVVGLMALARRFWGKWQIGLLAGALSALVHAQLEFWHSAQPETFGGMLSVLGLWLGTRTTRRARLGWLLTGAVFGMAGLLKPPLAGGGAVLACWLAQGRFAEPTDYRLGSRLGRALAPLVWIAIGGVLPFLLMGLWLWQGGALAETYHTLFVFTPHYTALGWQGKQLLSLCYQALATWLFSYCSLLTVGLLAIPLAGRAVWRQRPLGLLLAMVAIQLVGVALQAKFFPYHYAGLWPLAALLSAFGLWHSWSRLWRITRRRGIHPAWASVAMCALLLVASTLRTASKDLPEPFHRRVVKRLRLWVMPDDEARARLQAELASVADVDAWHNQQVAQELAGRLSAETAIYIWGFEPAIYDLSQRPPASRFIYNVPQRVGWASQWARRELMADLQRSRPGAVVVTHGDVISMVTGDGTDSALVLEDFPALSQWLRRDYRLLKSIGDFDIYLRLADVERGK